jgi:hypothetical protein
MSDKGKIIASLERKGLLDKESIRHLRNRLKLKLKEEQKEQKKEMLFLRKELTLLHVRLTN